MTIRTLPTTCPSCGKRLHLTRLECNACGTRVEGDFALPPLSRLSPDDQSFVVEFVKASGSLKALARAYRVSYPTVRNRLDGLIERLTAEEEAAAHETEEEES